MKIGRTFTLMTAGLLGASLLYSPLAYTGLQGSSRTIRIGRIGIIPQSVEIKTGESFTWVNSSPAFAQVVFDRDVEQRVVCAQDEQGVSEAREVLLPSGSSTSCTLELGTYTYTVHRQVAYRSGGGEVKRSRGTIVVR